MCSRSSWGGGLTEDEGGGDKFVALYHFSSSIQFRALYALLDKHPLRLDDGVDIFFSLDEENSFTVSAHELIEECTNSRSQTYQDLQRQAGDSPSLSLEILMDQTRVLRGLEKFNRNCDGIITLEEWKEFLAEVIEKDLNFAIEKGMKYALMHVVQLCCDSI